jgi:hypothetical protein
MNIKRIVLVGMFCVILLIPACGGGQLVETIATATAVPIRDEPLQEVWFYVG